MGNVNQRWELPKNVDNSVVDVDNRETPAIHDKPLIVLRDNRETPAIDDKPLIVLGVIVGHTKKEPGATSYFGESEYAYNTKVAEAMGEYASLRNFGITVEILKRDQAGIDGAYRRAMQLGCDAVIELHFNAFNGAARGTETLCSMDDQDQEFAHYIQTAMCEVFNRDGLSRGVKPISRSSRGGRNVYSFPPGVNCLVEPFFGDNDKDATLGRDLLKRYAQSLVDATREWAIHKKLLS